MQLLNRTSLNPSDKLNLLVKTITCQAHETISFLSNDFKISRKAVCKARDTVLTALNELVTDEYQPQYISRVSVDKSQLRRAIVALSITSANSIRAIQEQIPLIYLGYTP
jgi:hypothetical protein